MKDIYLAGGCFWGLQKAMSLMDGVVRTECGYANGDPHFVPDYLLVCSGRFGYVETVKVTYDPGRIGLSKILKAFFMVIDPTKLNRQGNDVGIQYRTGIYWTDEDVGSEAVQIAKKVSESFNEFYTELLPLENFTPAEEYHQYYLDKNPHGYCHIPACVLESIAELRCIWHLYPDCIRSPSTVEHVVMCKGV